MKTDSLWHNAEHRTPGLEWHCNSLHPDVVGADLRPLLDPNSSVGLKDAEVFRIELGGS
jgi:hypothetical protein